MENDNLTLDDLIRAYLRFKEWMDYDAERSAYCAKEIIVMQKLFGTKYITAPANLTMFGYDDLLSAMEKRQADLTALTEAIDGSSGEDEIDGLLKEVEKTSFKSTTHYFITLHQAIWQAVDSARLDVESDHEELVLDSEPFDDHFEEVDDAMFEEIRIFIISEHPQIEFMSFPQKTAYDLGLPKRAPQPIAYIIH